MEYDFYRSPEGLFEAKFSVEQHAFSQWFNEELGNDKHKIIDLLNIITQIRKKDLQQHQIQGQFHQLTLNRDEVNVQDLGLPLDPQAYATPKPSHVDDDDAPDLTESDPDESSDEEKPTLSEDAMLCGCGLDDFEYAVKAWLKFISEE